MQADISFLPFQIESLTNRLPFPDPSLNQSLEVTYQKAINLLKIENKSMAELQMSPGNASGDQQFNVVCLPTAACLLSASVPHLMPHPSETV